MFNINNRVLVTLYENGTISKPKNYGLIKSEVCIAMETRGTMEQHTEEELELVVGLTWEPKEEATE